MVMSTLNISMPEAMRQFVEAQAAAGSFSASEYIRHLIRLDEQRALEQQRELWGRLLAVSEAEINEGKLSHITVDALIEQSAAKLNRRGKRLKK